MLYLKNLVGVSLITLPSWFPSISPLPLLLLLRSKLRGSQPFIGIQLCNQTMSTTSSTPLMYSANFKKCMNLHQPMMQPTPSSLPLSLQSSLSIISTATSYHTQRGPRATTPVRTTLGTMTRAKLLDWPIERRTRSGGLMIPVHYLPTVSSAGLCERLGVVG